MEEKEASICVSEFKNPMKEELIKEEEVIDAGLIENLGNDFNELGGATPIFIPWFSDDPQLPFREGRAPGGEFVGNIKLDDSDELQIWYLFRSVLGLTPSKWDQKLGIFFV